MAAATQAAIGNRKRCALMIITIMTAATAILTRNQPPPMCAIAKAMKGFLMFTWLKGWFQRKSNGNMFELISWFIMILLLIDRDYIWLFIWENGNIPAGEF
jgi:hypothetical protein